MFIQFLAIPVMPFSAFTIVLPVALALRSVAFFSTGLGDASNALIALAIALYVIYPMMIAFDGYAIPGVFSRQQPLSAICRSRLHGQFRRPRTPSSRPSHNLTSAVRTLLRARVAFVLSALSASGSYNYAFQSLNLIGTLRNYTNAMAQFFFESILLFALNMAVTVGLAVASTRHSRPAWERPGGSGDMMIPTFLLSAPTNIAPVEANIIPIVMVALLLDVCIVAVWYFAALSRFQSRRGSRSYRPRPGSVS